MQGHAGHLHIQSEPGFGSRFSAELPLPTHTEAIAPAALQGKVVALSDAGSGLSELLQGLLPGWGWTTNGTTAAQRSTAASTC